jgi:hypothetical protein
MDILPTPLTDTQRAIESQLLRKELETHSFDEIVETKVQAVLAWEEIKNPLTQRFYKNSATIFTKDELRAYYRASLIQILGIDLPKVTAS